MIQKRLVCSIALLFWISSPTLFAQDFLKQLEEKLLQKQSSQKKEEASKEDPEKESSTETDPTKGLGTTKMGASPLQPPPLIIGDPDGSEETLPPPKPTPKPRKKPGSSTNLVEPLTAPETSLSKKEGAINPGVGASSPGYLGMTVESLVGGGFGLSVVAVTQNSPAWKAGFQPGDKVIAVNGAAVASVDSFAESMGVLPAGNAVKFLVDRKGRNVTLTAVLMDRDLATKINGPQNMPIPYEPTTLDGQAFLGLNVSDMSPAFRTQFAIPAYRGASVTDVTRGSPADAAGLRPGDCIIGFNGREVQSANEVMEAVFSSSPGEVVTISFYRGMALRQASAVLARADGLELPKISREITQEMLSADYVADLHAELDRLNAELKDSQQRIQQLENRLRQLERQR